MTKKLFQDVVYNTENKLHELLQHKNKSIPSLRKRNILIFSLVKQTDFVIVL